MKSLALILCPSSSLLADDPAGIAFFEPRTHTKMHEWDSGRMGVLRHMHLRPIRVHSWFKGVPSSKACRRAVPAHDARMDRATASQQIREHANAASACVTKIHPLLNALGDDATKGEIVKALFEITKNVEVVKKQIMRLEKRDDTSLL